MIAFFRKWIAFVFFWKETKAPTSKPADEPAPEEPTGIEVRLGGGPEQQISRRERRAIDSRRRKLERARLKFDKFVEPSGPTPKKKERSIVAPPRSTVAFEVDDPNDIVIWDRHHSDRKTPVLYEWGEMANDEFNFRDTILDQLERYFVYLRRMRRNDSEAYEFYRHFGATLLPYSATPDVWVRHKEEPETVARKLSPWFAEKRPAFGCIAYGTSPEIEKREEETDEFCPGKAKLTRWIPRFLYFTKYHKPPPEIEAISGGDVYCLTVWWDRAQNRKMKYGIPQSFAVHVARDGKVSVLRTLETKYIPVKGKNGSFAYPQRAWQIDAEYKAWAKEHKTSVHILLGNLFCTMGDHLEHAALSMVKVSVEKDGSYATFRLEALRTPYFFRDRDIELTSSGYKKPIFHVVRPTVRRNGETVPMHFRGQREFAWAGYNVTITVPGKDHIVFDECDVGFTDDYWIKKRDRRKFTSFGETGRKIRKLIHA